jgi:hypothetical protein
MLSGQVLLLDFQQESCFNKVIPNSWFLLSDKSDPFFPSDASGCMLKSSPVVGLLYLGR